MKKNLFCHRRFWPKG